MGADPSCSEAQGEVQGSPQYLISKHIALVWGGTGVLPLHPLGQHPLAVGSSACTSKGCRAQGLPSCPPALGAPGGGRSNQGTGNEIRSLSKLLFSGAEGRILQLRQGCFIYILGTKNDDC